MPAPCRLWAFTGVGHGLTNSENGVLLGNTVNRLLAPAKRES